MYKRSCSWLLTLIVLCAVVWLWDLDGLIPFSAFEKDNPLVFSIDSRVLAAAPAKPSSGSQSSSPAGQSHVKEHSLPLIVQRLYLKTDQVWITIARSGKSQLDLEDYPHILVKVAGSKTTGSDQWTLAQVDPTHALLNPKGKIDFNTRLLLKKSDLLIATITFGNWKHTKQETLKPSSMPSGSNIVQKGSGQGAAAPSQGNKQVQASGAARPAGTVPTSVPKGGPSSGGLTFAVPGAGQTVTAGEALYFILRFDRSIPEGDVTITLMRDTGFLTTKTYHYRPIQGEWSLASQFNIPTRGIFASDRYFLYAVHEAGNTGNSPFFSIRLPGREGLIRIINPKALDVYNPRQNMRINYQMTRAAASGLVRFEMFAFPYNADPPVLSWTSNYRAQPAGAPQPIFSKDIRLLADPTFSNEYFIQATHAEGSGRSGTFSVAPLINEGGAGVVGDIAVINVAKDPIDGTVKVLARVTGAGWPIWVECSPYPFPHAPGVTSVLLHPGDNAYAIDSAEFNGAGGDCSRNYSVRLDPDNHYTETNETNNNLEKEVFFLDRNGSLSVFGHSRSDSTLHIPYDSHHPGSRAFDFVFHYCGSNRDNMWFLVREIHQKGVKHWSIGDVPFDQIVPYEKWVTDDCDHLGRERREDIYVESGQCVLIRLNQDGLEHVESDVTIYLNEPYASMPGVRNPLTVHINWTF